MNENELNELARAEPMKKRNSFAKLEPYKKAIRILYRHKRFSVKAIAEWLWNNTDISCSQSTIYQYLINSKIHKA